MKRIFILIFLLSQIVFSKTASWYGKGFEGKLTASGYIYSADQLTCASNRYPFGTVLKVIIGEVAVMPGLTYGEEGRYFLRLNVACSIKKVKDGLERIKKSVDYIREIKTK